jgi:DNA-binding MarR family transcriptional regulator
MRISRTQNDILTTLYKCLIKGIQCVSSSELNDAVDHIQQGKVDRDSFRRSCKTLVDNGLLMRQRIDLKLYVDLTPKGFELAQELTEREHNGQR